MAPKTEITNTNNSFAAIIFAVFAVVCIVAFLAYRGSDVGQLPTLVGNLGGGDIFGARGFNDSMIGIAVAQVLIISWFGLGAFVAPFILKTNEKPGLFLVVQHIAIGAALWSLIWFVLGLFGAYLGFVAIAAVAVGWGLTVIKALQLLAKRKEMPRYERMSIGKLMSRETITVAIVLSLLASVAPPIAKDALLYHFAVPKAFIAQHGNAFIEGNIASYLSLGTEMHYVWAMLLGGFEGTGVAEAAAGATGFMFFPILLAVVYGWANDIGISGTSAMLATATVATVPSAYHVASSGYIDIALALFVTLAIYALCRWWKLQDRSSLILIAIFLGAALSIKLTSVFVIAAFGLVILFRARKNPVATAPGSDMEQTAGRIVIGGFAALLLAGVIASPWYIRTWVATGSPVFPFYMSIWPGKANGWDVERSNLFQSMNTQYGGADTNKLNYVTAPVRVSIAAQPEQPGYYDGVLGVAFLIGLPLLICALWKFDLPVEVKIGAGVAGIMYLFWLFSSEQLRYLLPIIPVLAITIVASAEKIGGAVSKVARCAFIAAAICSLLTTAAWFCQKAPLRVVLGGETRDQYLTRNLDYYPYYQEINSATPTDSKVWLINMRRDTYNIDRPIFSDYLFEDWTLRRMIWESHSVEEMRTKTAGMGIKYVLTRHDFLFDFDRSTLVDDKKPRPENEAKLKIAKEFILDPANTVKADSKFSLIKVF